MPLSCPNFTGYSHPNTADFVTNDQGVTGDDSWNVNVICPDVPQEECVLTQGYWKTHSDLGPAHWPDDTWDLVGGPNTTFFLSEQTYFQVMWTPPQKGNVYYILAHQYIAAELNSLSGASLCPGAVTDAFNAATAWFATADPATNIKGPVRNTLLGYANTLTQFNEGYLCRDHCTEDGSSAP